MFNNDFIKEIHSHPEAGKVPAEMREAMIGIFEDVLLKMQERRRCIVAPLMEGGADGGLRKA